MDINTVNNNNNHNHHVPLSKSMQIYTRRTHTKRSICMSDYKYTFEYKVTLKQFQFNNISIVDALSSSSSSLATIMFSLLLASIQNTARFHKRQTYNFLFFISLKIWQFFQFIVVIVIFRPFEPPPPPPPSSTTTKTELVWILPLMSYCHKYNIINSKKMEIHTSLHTIFFCVIWALLLHVYFRRLQFFLSLSASLLLHYMRYFVLVIIGKYIKMVLNLYGFGWIANLRDMYSYSFMFDIYIYSAFMHVCDHNDPFFERKDCNERKNRMERNWTKR